MAAVQKIRTFLWFNTNAEEAVNFYISLFPDSKILRVSRYSELGPGPAGSVMVIEFQLAGVPFLALNGGPTYQFTEAISLSVDCTSQEEIDTLWNQLTAGGEPGRCGWLKDKFGLSWQLVPATLVSMMSDPDAAKVRRVTEAMFSMAKLEIAALQSAFEGTSGS